MHYDAIYSGEDDYNTVLIGAPATTINNLQLSWRDQVIYRNIVEPRTQFPLNSAMNHSPITYKWTDDRHKSDQGSRHMQTYSYSTSFEDRRSLRCT